MRTPGTLDWLPIDALRSSPALRRAEDDHRPRAACSAPLTRALLWKLSDFREDSLERGGHEFMHRAGS